VDLFSLKRTNIHKITHILQDKTETQSQVHLPGKSSFLALHHAVFAVLTHFWLPPSQKGYQKKALKPSSLYPSQKSCSLLLGSSTITWGPRIASGRLSSTEMDGYPENLPGARTFPWISYRLAFGYFGF
jgi:hypothetical protein